MSTWTDEESNHSAHGFKKLIEADEQTANAAGSVLGYVCRSQHGGTTETESFNEAGLYSVTEP